GAAVLLQAAPRAIVPAARPRLGLPLRVAALPGAHRLPLAPVCSAPQLVPRQPACAVLRLLPRRPVVRPGGAPLRPRPPAPVHGRVLPLRRLRGAAAPGPGDAGAAGCPC